MCGLSQRQDVCNPDAAEFTGCSELDYPGGIIPAEILIRQISLAQTRPLRHTVLRPHQSVADLERAEPEDAFAVGAFRAEELVAVGFIAPHDRAAGSWRVRGMATRQEARGHGAGSAVLQALLEHAQAQGAQLVWCNGRLPALSLYERAGFVAASERFEVPQIGPHVVLEWRQVGRSKVGPMPVNSHKQ
ncbi:MAG: GNAT family N-acetyltransferase [Solirubrobacteraceae bacterium]